MIKGLPVTDVNDNQAVQILTERFDNKKLIISAHMKALLKLKLVSSLFEVKGIRYVLIKLEFKSGVHIPSNRFYALWYCFNTNIHGEVAGRIVIDGL